MDLKDFVPIEMLNQIHEVDHYSETWETMLENDNESLECFKPVSHEENLNALYLLPSLMMGSDYSGCAVEKSNQRVFLEEFKKEDAEGSDANGVLSLYGGHNTYGVAIRLDVLKENEEMQECLNALGDYPVIDDEDLSNLEMELQDESWEGYVKSDFENEIEDGLGIDDVEEIGLNDEKIYNLFNYLCEAANEYWIIEEGCNAYIDLKSIMENFEEDFKSWKQVCIDENNGQKFLQLTS